MQVEALLQASPSPSTSGTRAELAGLGVWEVTKGWNHMENRLECGAGLVLWTVEGGRTHLLIVFPVVPPLQDFKELATLWSLLLCFVTCLVSADIQQGQESLVEVVGLQVLLHWC